MVSTMSKRSGGNAARGRARPGLFAEAARVPPGPCSCAHWDTNRVSTLRSCGEDKYLQQLAWQARPIFAPRQGAGCDGVGRNKRSALHAFISTRSPKSYGGDMAGREVGALAPERRNALCLLR